MVGVIESADETLLRDGADGPELLARFQPLGLVEGAELLDPRADLLVGRRVLDDARDGQEGRDRREGHTRLDERAVPSWD